MRIGQKKIILASNSIQNGPGATKKAESRDSLHLRCRCSIGLLNVPDCIW